MDITIKIRRAPPREGEPQQVLIRETVDGATTRRAAVDAAEFERLTAGCAEAGSRNPTLAAAGILLDMASSESLADKLGRFTVVRHPPEGSEIEELLAGGGHEMAEETLSDAEIADLMASIYHWHAVDAPQPSIRERVRPITLHVSDAVTLDWDEEPLEEAIEKYRAYYYIDG
jgi:hypothetical protein